MHVEHVRRSTRGHNANGHKLLACSRNPRVSTSNHRGKGPSLGTVKNNRPQSRAMGMNDDDRGERIIVFERVALECCHDLSFGRTGRASQASRGINSMMKNAVHSALLAALRALKQFSRGRVKASCEKIAKLTLHDEARTARDSCHSEVCRGVRIESLRPDPSADLGVTARSG